MRTGLGARTNFLGTRFGETGGDVGASRIDVSEELLEAVAARVVDRVREDLARSSDGPENEDAWSQSGYSERDASGWPRGT
jgi:hypothetical protein